MELAAILLAFGVIALLLFISAVINGFVISTLWGWFMVPLFGLPSISIAAGIGLGLLFSFAGGIKSQSTDKEKSVEKAVIALLVPLLTLLIGYIAKGFL